jgi:DNA-binding CsgD family transcriptional regulator
MEGHMRDREVCIVGTNKLQNQLLATFLSRETGARCTAAPTLRGVPPIAGTARHLLLLDCFNLSRDHIIEQHVREARQAHPGHTLALFNVCPGIGAETAAVMAAVKDILYLGDNLITLIAAVREALGESTSLIHVGTRREGAGSPLTRREQHILTLLANGYSNREISDQLFISLPTVKTHVSRIFRKIRVTSRLQAARWAGQRGAQLAEETDPSSRDRQNHTFGRLTL